MGLFDSISFALFRICAKFGHWMVYVEEGHARCRICGCHHFCSHATDEQIQRYLTDNTSTHLEGRV